MTAHPAHPRPDAAKVLNALAQPLITVDVQGMVIDVNAAAENLLRHGARNAVAPRASRTFFRPTPPFMALVADALGNRATVNDCRRRFHASGSVVEMSMFSSRPYRKRTIGLRLCCKNGRLPKK